MAIGRHLSIDPSGMWSARQAKAILEVIEPEAEAMGLYFQQLDVTEQGMPESRFLLQAYCRTHGWPVSPDSACEICIGDAPSSWVGVRAKCLAP